MNARNHLVTLLHQFLDQALTVKQFCDAYEHVFNFDINKSELPYDEFTAFQMLFDEVVYYSPYEADRVNYSGYRDDRQIREAAARVVEQLQL